MTHYDLYRSLGISPQTSTRDIVDALDHRIDAKWFDNLGGEEEIRLAREVLGNATKRAFYDARLNHPGASYMTVHDLRELRDLSLPAPAESVPQEEPVAPPQMVAATPPAPPLPPAPPPLPPNQVPQTGLLPATPSSPTPQGSAGESQEITLLKDIYRDSFSMYRSNPGTWVAIIGITITTALLAIFPVLYLAFRDVINMLFMSDETAADYMFDSWIASSEASLMRFFVTGLLLYVLLWIWAGVVDGAVVILTSRAQIAHFHGRPVTLQSYFTLDRSFWRALRAYLPTAVTLGVTIGIFPILSLPLVLFRFTPHFALTEGSGAWQSMKSSVKFMGRNFTSVLLYFFSSAVVVFIPFLLVLTAPGAVLPMLLFVVLIVPEYYLLSAAAAALFHRCQTSNPVTVSPARH